MIKQAKMQLVVVFAASVVFVVFVVFVVVVVVVVYAEWPNAAKTFMATQKNSKQGKQREKLKLKRFVTAILAVIQLQLEKGDSLAQM